MDIMYQKVSSHVLNKHNVDISVFEESYIIKKITDKMNELKTTSIEDFLSHLNDQESFMSFYSSFFNTYSRFFREPITFEYIYAHLIELIKSGVKTVRIWSNACSNGQEAYSLMMLLENIKTEYSFDFEYILFASDISESTLNYARNAKYGAFDIENVKSKDLERYFRKVNGDYLIKEEYKKNVHFVLYDSVEHDQLYPSESIYGGFDIIFCSNLLIYYSHEVQKDIINDLKESINCGGLFVTSSSEIKLVEEILDETRVNLFIPIVKMRR